MLDEGDILGDKIVRNTEHEKLLVIDTLRSWNMITHIVLPIYRLRDIIQKCFCISDGPMDPTFPIKYDSACLYVWNQRNSAKT